MGVWPHICIKKIRPTIYSNAGGPMKKTEKQRLLDYYKRKLGIFTGKIIFYLGNILKDDKIWKLHKKNIQLKFQDPYFMVSVSRIFMELSNNQWIKHQTGRLGISD